jgi:hypothetical protein
MTSICCQRNIDMTSTFEVPPVTLVEGASRPTVRRAAAVRPRISSMRDPRVNGDQIVDNDRRKPAGLHVAVLLGGCHVLAAAFDRAE